MMSSRTNWLITCALAMVLGCGTGEVKPDDAPTDTTTAVSYTHLTLPTTPYV